MRSAATALILIALLATPAGADDDKGKNKRQGDRVTSQRNDDDRRGRVNRDNDDRDDDDDDDDDDNDGEDNRDRNRNRGSRADNRDRTDQDRGVLGRVLGRGRALPRSDRDTGANSQRVPFDNGYQDGLIKGREDALDSRSSDPATHGWYRTGDRGYNSQYGSREQYRSAYREGFLSGYRESYRGAAGGRDTRRPSWWPF